MKRRASEELPVRPVSFAVLAALADHPRPGFEILRVIDETVSGHSIIGAGTLYRLLRELRRAGWIERTASPAGEEPDDRRQYHRLTTAGRNVLRAEAARLRKTLDVAGLLSESQRG